MKKAPDLPEEKPSAPTQAQEYPAILAGCALYFLPGELHEIRALADGRTLTHIAATADDAASFIAALPQDYRGVYITLNPVSITAGSARDAVVIRRRWLLIDLDPVRPAGTSATDAERDAALMLGFTVAADLAARGWSQPRIVMSGNGCHLLYPIDLPNDGASTALVKGVLKALAAKYDTPTVTVDTSVCNASRIVRVPGTWARKGPNTPERPHRVACVLQEATW